MSLLFSIRCLAFAVFILCLILALFCFCWLKQYIFHKHLYICSGPGGDTGRRGSGWAFENIWYSFPWCSCLPLSGSNPSPQMCPPSSCEETRGCPPRFASQSRWASVSHLLGYRRSSLRNKTHIQMSQTQLKIQKIMISIIHWSCFTYIDMLAYPV